MQLYKQTGWTGSLGQLQFSWPVLSVPSTAGSPRPGTVLRHFGSGLSGQAGAGVAILETGLASNQKTGTVQSFADYYTDKLF